LNAGFDLFAYVCRENIESEPVVDERFIISPSPGETVDHLDTVLAST